MPAKKATKASRNGGSTKKSTAKKKKKAAPTKRAAAKSKRAAKSSKSTAAKAQSTAEKGAKGKAAKSTAGKANKSNAAKSNAAKSNATKSNVTKSNAAKSNAAKSNAAKSNAAKSKGKPAARKAKPPSPQEQDDNATTKASPDAAPAAEELDSKRSGSAAEADRIIESELAASGIAEQAELMLDTRRTVATKAARILHEVVAQKPDLLVSHVEKFARGLTSKQKRVVQTSADALPAIAKISPARVAKHLPTLKEAFEPTLADGRDGLVRTFANLCTASVAYQKRLEPILTHALEGANGKTLLRWSEIVLPALKGEPHARARAVVEDRLDRIPRAIAQQIANNLGFKLRVRYR